MDFGSICRTCLTADGILFSVFDPVVTESDNLTSGVSAAEMLKVFTTIVIMPDDGLPNQICTNCLTEVHNAYTFKIKSEKTQSTLQSLADEFVSTTIDKTQTIDQTSDSNSQNDHRVLSTTNKSDTVSNNDDEDDLSIFPDGLEELLKLSPASLLGDLDIPLEDLSDADVEMLKIHLNLDEIVDELNALESISTENSDSSNDAKYSKKSPNTLYKCVACSKQYQKINKLRSHMVEFHTDGKLCKICNKECQLKMWKHVYDHLPERSFACIDCGKSFHSQFNLEMHRKMAHDDWLTCEYCSAKFRNLERYRDHVYTHTGKHDFQCDICLKVLKRRSALILHKQNHAGERPFKCEHCGKTFGYKGNLKFHIIARHGQDKLPLKCDICSMRFKNRPQLVKHKFEHSGNTEMQCDVCFEYFETRYKLDLHRRKHTGEKPLKCEICGRGFRLKCNLKEHIGTHSGDRPFECQWCPCRYKRGYLLTSHVRKVHPDVKL